MTGVSWLFEAKFHPVYAIPQAYSRRAVSGDSIGGIALNCKFYLGNKALMSGAPHGLILEITLKDRLIDQVEISLEDIDEFMQAGRNDMAGVRTVKRLA